MKNKSILKPSSWLLCLLTTLMIWTGFPTKVYAGFPINKAEPNLDYTIDTTDIVVGGDATLNVSWDGDGEIDIYIEDETVVDYGVIDEGIYGFIGQKAGTSGVTITISATDNYNEATASFTITVSGEVIEEFEITELPSAYFYKGTTPCLIGDFAVATGSNVSIIETKVSNGKGLALIRPDEGYVFNRSGQFLDISITGEAADETGSASGSAYESVFTSVQDGDVFIAVDLDEDKYAGVQELNATMAYNKVTGIVNVTGAKLDKTSIDENGTDYTLLAGYDIYANYGSDMDFTSVVPNKTTAHYGTGIWAWSFSGDLNKGGSNGVTNGSLEIDLKNLTYTTSTGLHIFVYSNHELDENDYSVYGYKFFTLPSKITFNLEGGNISGSTSNVARYLLNGDAIDSTLIANPEKEDYIFAGWFTAAEGGTKVTSYTGEDNIELHAQYIPEHNWTKLTKNTMNISSLDGVTLKEAKAIAEYHLGTETDNIAIYTEPVAGTGNYEHVEWNNAQWLSSGTQNSVYEYRTGVDSIDIYVIGKTVECPDYTITEITKPYSSITFDRTWDNSQAEFIRSVNESTLLKDLSDTHDVFLIYGEDKAIHITSAGGDMSRSYVTDESVWADKVGSSNTTIRTIGTPVDLSYKVNTFTKYHQIEELDLTANQAAQIISNDNLSLQNGDVVVYSIKKNGTKYDVELLVKNEDTALYWEIGMCPYVLSGTNKVTDYENLINKLIEEGKYNSDLPITKDSTFKVLADINYKNLIKLSEGVSVDPETWEIKLKDTNKYSYYGGMASKELIEQELEGMATERIYQVLINKTGEYAQTALVDGDVLSIEPNMSYLFYRVPKDLDTTDEAYPDAYGSFKLPEPVVKMVVGAGKDATVTYYPNLVSAAKSLDTTKENTLTLLQDTVENKTVSFNNDTTVKLDLNGHEVSFSSKVLSSAMVVSGSDVTITGKGTIRADSSKLVIYVAGYFDDELHSILKIDKNVTVKGNVSEEILYIGNGYGSKVEVLGTLDASESETAYALRFASTTDGTNNPHIVLNGSTIKGEVRLEGIGSANIKNATKIKAVGTGLYVKNADVTIKDIRIEIDPIEISETEFIVNAILFDENGNGSLNISGGSFGGEINVPESLTKFVTGGDFAWLEKECVADGYGRKPSQTLGFNHEVVAKTKATKIEFTGAPDKWSDDGSEIFDAYVLKDDGVALVLESSIDDFSNSPYGEVAMRVASDELYYFTVDTSITGLKGDDVSTTFITATNIDDLTDKYGFSFELGDFLVIDKKIHRANATAIEGISIDNNLKVDFANDDGLYFINEFNTQTAAKADYDDVTSKPALTYDLVFTTEDDMVNSAVEDRDSLKSYSGKIIVIYHSDRAWQDELTEEWHALIDKASLVNVPELTEINGSKVSGGARGEFYIASTSSLPAHIEGMELSDVKGTDYSGLVVWMDKNSNGSLDSGEQLVYNTDYELSAGSIVVTLKKSFLDTLAVGSHVINVDVTDKYNIEHSFEIPVLIKAKSNTNNSSDTGYKVVNTGVEGNETSYGSGLTWGILCGALFAFCVVIYSKKKYKHN